MIDSGPSLKAAEGLGASELASYLVARGWIGAPARIDGVSIFTKAFPGADTPVELVLPNKKGFSDENRRVADALRTLAQIEGRSEAAIAEAVRQEKKGREVLVTLSDGEREALARVMDGQSDNEIVKTFKHVLGKLDASNKSRAIAKTKSKGF